MKAPRALALAILCTSAFAQLPPPQAPRPRLDESDLKHHQDEPLASVEVEAVVTDAQGHPVPGLAEADFEVLQDDKPQKISEFSYVDGSRGRTLIFLIDDLGLTAEALGSTRAAVRHFIEAGMRPEDRVAILATAKGAASQQQFSSDPHYLFTALDAIRPGAPDARRGDAAGLARGALCQLRMVFDNLRKESGRKSVVFFSGNLRSAGIGKALGRSPFTALLDAAGHSSVVFYDVDPHAPVAEVTGKVPVGPKAAAPLLFSTRSLVELETGLPAVAKETGGMFFETGDPARAIEQVEQDSQGFYRLAYPVTESNYKYGDRYDNVQVRVKSPGLTVRAGLATLADGQAYQWPGEELPRELAMPFSAGSLTMRLTPLFENQPQGSSVEALLHLDLHGVAMTEDLKGIRQSQIHLAAGILGPGAQPVDEYASTLTLKLPPQDYQTAMRTGISFSLRLPLRRTTPGGWQFWVVARDEADGKTGSASEFIEIPNLANGNLALSGLTLQGMGMKMPGGENVVSSANDAPSLRLFRPGETLRYSYSAYNLAADKEKRSRIEVWIGLYRNGEKVFEGRPLPLEFPPSDSPSRRSASGTVALGSGMAAGSYLFQLHIKDTLAPAGKPSTAIQYADFELRP
jgi:VWFA-related protein